MRKTERAGHVPMALVLAVILLMSGCVSSRRWDAVDFPLSVAGAESVAVDWSGAILSISPGAPEAVRTLVTVGQGGRWTVKVRINSSTPAIPPFVKGWTVSFRVDDPVVFFGGNRVTTGDSVTRSFEVWREHDGRLYARRR